MEHRDKQGQEQQPTAQQGQQQPTAQQGQQQQQQGQQGQAEYAQAQQQPETSQSGGQQTEPAAQADYGSAGGIEGLDREDADIEGASSSGQASSGSFMGQERSGDTSSELIEDDDGFARDGQGASE